MIKLYITRDFAEGISNITQNVKGVFISAVVKGVPLDEAGLHYDRPIVSIGQL